RQALPLCPRAPDPARTLTTPTWHRRRPAPWTRTLFFLRRREGRRGRASSSTSCELAHGPKLSAAEVTQPGAGRRRDEDRPAARHAAGGARRRPETEQ